MKKQIGLFAAFSMFAFMAHATELAAAKVIPTQVLQNSVNLADYSASLDIVCQYQSGIFWPTPADCGGSSQPVVIDAQGQLHVPAIQSLNGIEGQDLNNFKISIVVTKIGAAAGSGTLFMLSMNTKGEVQNYLAETGTLQIVKLDSASLQVLVDGQDLANSSLSKDPLAELSASVQNATDMTNPNPNPGALLISMLSYTQGYSNESYEPAAQQLSSFTRYQFPPAALIQYTTNPQNYVLTVQFNVRETTGLDQYYRASVPVSMTVDGLSKTSSVNLQRVQ